MGSSCICSSAATMAPPCGCDPNTIDYCPGANKRSRVSSGSQILYLKVFSMIHRPRILIETCAVCTDGLEKHPNATFKHFGALFLQTIRCKLANTYEQPFASLCAFAKPWRPRVGIPMSLAPTLGHHQSPRIVSAQLLLSTRPGAGLIIPYGRR